ncbi:uncharacterized protein LOC112690996 [Sipha flava]|uniref:Uncharacterized protein LOC112690996 n=2 Tax=Sipha flava TaxID=143950 RepID=A0A8B8GCE6_9HEMI|nr:uncharacterized protein LOC112690996 [Sipha flava]
MDEQKRPIFIARHKTLERAVKSFETEQRNILSSPVELNRFDEFTSLDIETTENMEQLCGEIRVVFTKIRGYPSTTQQDAMVGRENAFNVHASFSLPKIELPKFDGSLINWFTFRDMFTSLVYENRSITDVERFHYLVSCLSGSALNIVKSVPLTSDNYAIAWCALRNRYDNKRLLAIAHCDKLFSFGRLQQESVSSLLSVFNTFRENVAAMKALGTVDLSGFLLFYIGARIIDPDTRRLFETSLPQERIPSLDELLDFADNRCKIFENFGANTTTLSVGNSSSRKGKGSQTPVKTSLSTTATSRNKCSFGERDHPLFRCLAFKKKTVVERREFVTNNELYFVCLRPNHEENSCKSEYLCKLCEGRHSVLLHVD